MEEAKCLYCDAVFNHEFKGYGLKNLIKHIENVHLIKYEDYIILNFHNGNKPLCLCGCGTETQFRKGKFLKYYLDHYNKIKGDLKSFKIGAKSIEDRIKNSGFTREFLYDLYLEFCSMNSNYTSISKKTGLDKRTIFKYWKDLEFIDNLENFKRIVKKNQTKPENRKTDLKQKIDETLLFDSYYMLKQNPNTLTLSIIKNKLNINNSDKVLYDRLCDFFTKPEIDNLLGKGLSSQEENNFYLILCYYFGRNNIKKSFRIGRKIYDFLLFGKLIIEFDGEYWHSLEKNIKNDTEKNKLAMDNGYYIFRVSDKKAKDPNIILKIKKIINEIQAKRDL